VIYYRFIYSSLLSEGKNAGTKNRRNMYANMLPKIGKYAVKYAVVFSVFDLKIVYLTHLRSAFQKYARCRIREVRWNVKI